MGDRNRMERIVSEYLETTFAFNVVIDLTEDACYGLRDNSDFEDMKVQELVDITLKSVHPLFASRIKNELSLKNLSDAHESMRLIRFDVLMISRLDNEYHWYRVRLTPISEGSGHKVFYFNALPIDEIMKKNELDKTQAFNETVLKQLLHDHILVYVIDLDNEMSKLVYSTGKSEYDNYASQFESHKEMMRDLIDNYVSEDFVQSVEKFIDYKYIRTQFETKDRIVLIFRDKKNKAFELNVTKYSEYAKDYPLVIFAIKEIV